MADYEDDPGGKLRLTDPYGNEMNEQAKSCIICGACCTSADMNCYGDITIDDSDPIHKCEFHKRHGAPNNWYVSEDQKENSPVERELGMQGDNVKEAGNFAFTYKNEEDVGKEYEKEDPHYTNGAQK